MKRDINYRKISVKNTNTWRLNNTLLTNQEITEEIKEEIKKYLETKLMVCVLDESRHLRLEVVGWKWR